MKVTYCMTKTVKEYIVNTQWVKAYLDGLEDSGVPIRRP